MSGTGQFLKDRFSELLREYYRIPPPDNRFPDRGVQLRLDTRVVCKDNGQEFLPALVIDDQIPRNEVQFLCRPQTVDAVEKFYGETYKTPVLSRVPENLRTWKGRQEILNGFAAVQLSPKPELLLNILQYSTPSAQINFLDGTNRELGDPIYGRAPG